MRIVSANITGSLILNGVDVTDSLVSSSINSDSVNSKLNSLQSSTSSLNSFTSSYSTGSFTGSFKGDGTNLYNIPATGVTGLQLDKIASGAVTASVSANGFNVNSNVSITGSIVASGTSLVSGSSQINITGTTEYSTFSSSISTSIGSLSSSVATTTNTLSSSVSSSIGSLSSSVATTTVGTKNRVDSIEAKTGSYATTGSNTFIGTENITGNLTVTGSVIISSGSAVYNSSLNLTDTSSLTLNSGSNLYVYDSGIISGTFKGSVTGSLGINGNVSITGSIVASGTSLVSGSSQIDITSTTNYTTFSSSVSSSIGNLSSSVATTTLNLSSSIATTTSNLSSSIGSLSSSVATTTSGLASRINSVETNTGSYATTGSNIFVGSQVITGSLYITNDMVVQGCSCLQNITASAVSIGTNVVMLNTATPAVRFAGISVQDSGSNAGVTGSIFWDGLCNKWIYSNPSTVGYSGGMLISGPRNTGTIGNESPLTCNVIAKSGGGDHIYDSCIIDDGTTVCVNANLKGSGTACFGGGVTLSTTLGVGRAPESDVAILVKSIGTTSCTYAMILQDSGTNNLFIVKDSGAACFAGQVCVGSASIATRSLVVQAGSTNQAIMFKNCWGGDGTLYACGNATSLHYGFNTYSCSDVLFIANDGNVGIGTNTVTDGKLVISQAAVASTYKTYLALVSTLSYTDTSMGIDFINRGIGGDLSGRISVIREGSAVNYGMAFGTNLSNVYCQRLYISSCGCVGIGCNTPGYTLDVKGSGHFISDGATMLIESTQQTNSSILKIVQCANGGNGNTDQGLVVQTNAADGTSNIANFYDYNSGSPVSRVRFLKNGITCFQNTVCVAGQVSSEDVRIYRSAGTTTGYINFGSTGTNYLGFDGTRFSINGSINAGGATFSDVGDTCLVLRTTNSGNPRFKFCGAAGVFNRSAAADIMYFGESSDTGLYMFRGGTLMSDKGACTSTYGFTHCGASRWGRFGMPNSAYMYLETNADAGFYIDGQTRVGGYLCASGNIQGNNLILAANITGSGIRLGTGSYNSGYVSDGLWGSTATPNYITAPTGVGMRLGYWDNGSGLYGTAYGFDVSYRDGLNNPREYDAIVMRNDGQGTRPFKVTSYGNIYGVSKNFRIKHPLSSMNDTHYLIHTSIEGPQADLIYRGKVQLVDGKAEVNIDLASRMTDGTFEVLCQDVQSYTTNESGWSLTKSYVVGNILHIEAQDETATDIISWLVIGERKDDGIKNSAITDENGHVIVEELKPEEGL